MALGFGFNKVKIMAQAEKFVQQGKLSNAIAEYEKVIKEDPKDLTVLNTIGDLYARVGSNDQATVYFKKVGDYYAQDGFTVKAIAIYKKLTKLSPYNTENTSKLAELYSQQGLYNDARVHYMQVADHLLKSGDHNQAARILQKILELDPENTQTQSKLADLYKKLGKKDEARNIYSSAAESLYARGSYAAAEEALNHVLELDPKNTAALLLRGLIAVDAGDSHAAVTSLEQVTDLNSRPDGLRALLRAKLQSGSTNGVEDVADKLLSLHNDATGITTVAQWYVTNNQAEKALRLYEKYAERLFAGNPQALQDTLSPLTSRVRDNPAAFAILQRLLHQDGDNAQTAEMLELQANAAAQKGRYAEARDLYKKLSEIEPANVLHAQNYKQMLAKLGEDSATRILTPEEAAQAFMVEELDQSAPAVHQSYDPPTEKAIEAALTDAELYVSYNVPSKAIPPLEAALPLAPQDVNLNQRLASLYVRSERFADAARLYQNLSDIYKELGHPTESARYLEAARRYNLRAPAAQAAPAAPSAPASAPAKAAWPPPVEPAAPLHATVEEIPIEVEEVGAAPSVKEFTFDTPEIIAEQELPVVPLEPVRIEPPVARVSPQPAAAPPPAPAPPPPPAPAEPAQEIDISTEWEDMIEVEPVAAKTKLPVPPAPPLEIPVPPVAIEPEPESATPDLAAQIENKIQEIRFYITQAMWEPAKAAILDLTELSPDAPAITELIAAVSAGQGKAAQPRPEAPAPLPPIQVPIQIKETPVKIVDRPVVQPAPPVPPPPPRREPPAAPPTPPAQQYNVPPAKAATVPIDLDDVLELEERPKPQPKPQPIAPPPTPAPAPLASAPSTEDILGDFVLDLEESELADFAPKPKSQPAAKPAFVPAPPPSPAPVVQHSINGDLQNSETAQELSDILAELQEDTAIEETDEDPETHYNLGIAFKEMGLLDEAIGELQKVCRAVDRGVEFSQPIQALTWLAQCLVDKGAPEAAVRWYQKALKLPGLEDSSRCAIYYDLATAFEAAGDKKSALANLMEVYGSNIDFRDVASRIKALKS